MTDPGAIDIPDSLKAITPAWLSAAVQEVPPGARASAAIGDLGTAALIRDELGLAARVTR